MPCSQSCSFLRKRAYWAASSKFSSKRREIPGTISRTLVACATFNNNVGSQRRLRAPNYDRWTVHQIYGLRMTTTNCGLVDFMPIKPLARAMHALCSLQCRSGVSHWAMTSQVINHRTSSRNQVVDEKASHADAHSLHWPFCLRRQASQG